MKLLLGFAAHTAHKQPADLDLADLDAVMIGAFLTHLEANRGNAVTTRTRDWRRSARCSGTPRCMPPSTPP